MLYSLRLFGVDYDSYLHFPYKETAISFPLDFFFISVLFLTELLKEVTVAVEETFVKSVYEFVFSLVFPPFS